MRSKRGLQRKVLMFFGEQHCRQRGEICQGRFSALVCIAPVRVQTIKAGTRFTFGDRDAKIIASGKPVESTPGFVPPPGIAGDVGRGEASTDRRGSFQRLLVKRLGVAAIDTEGVGPDWPEMSGIGGLLPHQPLQRFQADSHLFGIALSVATHQQGLAQFCVVIAQPILEPGPT